jgi:cephalosporin-C deacetylase-like acetyl esterase
MKRVAAVLGLVLAAGLGAEEPLEVTAGLAGMVDRYLTEIAKKHWEARVAAIRTPGEERARQEYIRKKVMEALGGFPKKTPLNARVTGTLERDGYRVEKLIYESQPRFYVTANLYVPTRGRPPYPALLGTAGHSANGKAMEGYQRVWISLARRGFVVLAYDPPGQGERYEYFDTEKGKPRFGSTTEHTMAGLQCLLTGTNFARWEIFDGIRGLDYLLTRREVDRRRIGVAGNSGGGTQTAYLEVVEPRLAAAAPACYITSWEKLWGGSGPQDAEQNFAGFLSDGLDFGDFLIAFAPRPLKVVTATQDFFPIAGARASFAEARRVYELLGAGERIAFFEHDDKHGWSKPLRQATYQWMQRWLNHVEEAGTEADFATEPDANLNATATGQLATSLKGETVQSLNWALARRIYRPGRIKGAAKLRAAIAARMGLEVRRGAPPVAKAGEVSRTGYRIEKLALETEPGITVPVLVFVPGTGPERRPAVLWLNPAGKAAEAGPGGDIEALVKAGHLVLAPDLRGWGESALSRRLVVYGGAYQTAMRAILVGKTMVGMQVYDLLRVFDYLVSRADVDGSRIGVLGKGHGGVVGLLGAALEPRIHRVALEGAVLSYMQIARAALHENIVEIVIPGVLKDFDLPDVAGLATGLWLVEPRTPTGGKAAVLEAAAEYAPAGRVRIVERKGSKETYGEWMSR